MTAGSCPSTRLKYALAFVGRGEAPSYVEADGIPVINQACVHQDGIRWANIKLHDPEKVSASSAWLKSGDVLVNSTGTGTLGRVAFVDEEPQEPTIFDGHVTAIRTQPDALLPKFLFYWLCNRQDEITANASDGATNQIELNRARLGGFRISLPDLGTQAGIVSFLDRETAKIDTLIDEKERLLKLLDERRQALITEAVTRGLDPTVPLKPSGLPWLGDIPAHWTVKKIAYVAERIGSGTTPPTGEQEWYDDGTIPWVTTAELRERKIYETEKFVTKEALARFTALSVFPPDSVLIAMYGATIGRLGVLKTEATMNQACCAIQCGPLVTPEFLFQALWAAREHLINQSSGGGQPNISQEKVASLRIPLPLVEEQRQIVLHLDRAFKAFDSAAGLVVRAVDQLRNRRSAFIQEAVTGQLQIGGAA